MKNNLIIACVVSIVVNSCKCNFYNIPANITQGGRSTGVSIHPTDQNIIWVTTETGGVFKTTDGGKLWSHIDSIPHFATNDVQICRINPSVIIVSTGEDTKVNFDGGIWVSRDGGVRWSRPGSSVLTNADGSIKRYSAYGICFDSTRVYVGCDSGVLYSNDLGLNWSYINPETDGSKRPIYSVIALRSGKVLLYGQNGVWISNNGTTGWRHDRTGLSGDWNIFDAFAVSPRNNNHLFFTNAWESLWYSIDGGDNWNTIAVDYRWYNGRQPYVKVCASQSGRSDELDLYYSNMSLVGKKTIRWTGTNYSFSNAWQNVPFRHPDPADLAFANNGKDPYIAINDGGVEKSTDAGGTWNVISTPDRFFNALQVFNVKGTFYNGSPNRVDLYFGTQDNAFWGSGNDGATWPYATGNEGFEIQGPVSYTSTSDSTISYFNIGGCPWCKSNPHYANARDITKPTNDPTSIPVFAGGKQYICMAKPTPASQNALYISNTEGDSWTNTGVVLPRDNVGFPVVAGTGINRVVFVPHFVNGIQWTTYGIYIIKNAFNPGHTPSYTTMTFPTGCNLGTVPTMWPWYPCWSVDPRDPGFVIVPDVGTMQMIMSTDTGRTWTVRNDLTQLITDNGKYFFHKEFAAPQVRVIAIDPQNRDHILVGTDRAGVMFSRDRGVNWYKVPESEKIPYVLSFFFRNDSTAVVATYGRGLWRLFFKDDMTSVSLMGDTSRSERRRSPFPGRKEEQIKKIDGQFKEEVIRDTVAPKVTIKNDVPGSAVINVKAGKKILIQGDGWLFDEKGNNPIIVTIDNKPIDIKGNGVNRNGKFNIELPPLYEPKVYMLKVTQFDRNQNKKEIILPFKVSIADEMKESKGKGD